MRTFGTSAVAVIRSAANALREAPRGAAGGAAAKGRFSPARPRWTKAAGLSRDEELLCRRLDSGPQRPHREEKRQRERGLSGGMTDRAR